MAAIEESTGTRMLIALPPVCCSSESPLWEPGWVERARASAGKYSGEGLSGVRGSTPPDGSDGSCDAEQERSADERSASGR